MKFILKLYSILVDAKLRKVVSWGPGNRGFVIFRKKKFINEVLPKHFRTSVYESFQRQLNLHGFRKIKADRKNHTAFDHEHFCRGQTELLKLIQRKNKPADIQTR